MGFRSASDEGDSLLFDLLGDEEFSSESDVSFGRPHGGRRSRMPFLIGAAVVAVVGSVVVLSQDDDRRTGPAPSTAAPTPSTTIGTTTSRVAPSTTVPQPYAPLPEFASDPGYRVYLTRPDNSGPAIRFDLTTGESESTGREEVRRVTATENGAVISTWGEAVGPDGTVWSIANGSLLAATVDESGRRTLRATFGLSTLFGTYSEPLGVDSDGRLVIRGPDLSGYVVGPDGMISRPIDGVVLSASAGGIVRLGCDEQALCRLRVESVKGSFDIPIEGGSSWSPYAYAPDLSPDGRWLVMVGFGATSQFGRRELTLYELSTARTYGAVEGSSFAASAGGGWSPDGRYFFFMGEAGLVAFDASTSTFLALSTPDSLTWYSVAGVA